MCPLRFYIKLLPVSDLDFSKSWCHLILAFPVKWEYRKNNSYYLKRYFQETFCKSQGLIYPLLPILFQVGQFYEGSSTGVTKLTIRQLGQNSMMNEKGLQFQLSTTKVDYGFLTGAISLCTVVKTNHVCWILGINLLKFKYSHSLYLNTNELWKSSVRALIN